jgi:arylsulfatase
VIFFILDDMDYGQMSVFGGLCETPNLERLANRSLRYINDKLVTSRNLPHTVPNLSGIIGLSCGYDAADSVPPKNTGHRSLSQARSGKLNLTFQVN